MISPIYYNPAIITPYHKSEEQVTFQGIMQELAKSHRVWYWFDQIKDIPRPSTFYKDEAGTLLAGDCSAMADFMEAKLKEFGFTVTRKANNTIIASRGIVPGKKVIGLQAHMDMVEMPKINDMSERQPIRLVETGGWLHSENNARTIGADDGFGCAQMLAIAEHSKFKNTPFQFILTSDEETTMAGAASIKPEEIKANYLINLDSESHGKIVKGCTGSVRFAVRETIPMERLRDPENYTRIKIELKGARGAHSAYIQNDSLNPIQTLLTEVQGIKGAKLVSLEGGEKDNSVPMNAMVEILIPNDQVPTVMNSLKNNLETLRQERLAQNPALNYKITPGSANGARYVEPKFQERMFSALNSVFKGVRTVFEDSGIPKTTQNLSIVKIGDGSLYVKTMGRSFERKELDALKEENSKIWSQLFGKTINASDERPIWTPKENSPLVDMALRAYARANINADVGIERGGLESGIFAELRPDIEQISIGPDIREPHTVHERINIESGTKTQEVLENLIEEIDSNN